MGTDPRMRAIVEAGSREGTTERGDKVRTWDKIRSFIRFPIPIQHDTANQMCRPGFPSSLMDDLQGASQ